MLNAKGYCLIFNMDEFAFKFIFISLLMKKFPFEFHPTNACLVL